MARGSAAQIRRHGRVVASIGLPGVPAGTPGKVLLVTGLRGRRYRVLFDNGLERGLLDDRHVVPPADFVPLADRAARGEPSGSVDAPARDGQEADERAGEPARADSASRVPAHLLERSKQARQRLSSS